jgi:hypothetical protein
LLLFTFYLSYYPLFDTQNPSPTFTTELFDEFSRQFQYQFKFLPLPVKRFYNWPQQAEIDFKYPDNSNWLVAPALKESLLYSDSSVKLVTGTITAKNKAFGKPEDFKVLGTLLGFYPQLWLEQINSGKVRLYENPSTLVLIQQLLHGHVDGLDLEPSVVAHHLSLLGRNGELELNKAFAYSVYDFKLSTSKHPEVIKNFNQFLRNNQEFIQQLKDKYQILDHKPYLRSHTVKAS